MNIRIMEIEGPRFPYKFQSSKDAYDVLNVKVLRSIIGKTVANIKMGSRGYYSINGG